MRAGRLGRELVRELLTGLDGRLGDERHAVHGVGDFLAVEMDARRLVEVVGEDGADLVALGDPELGPGPRAVEAQGIDGVERRGEHVDDGVDGQVEDLGVAVHGRLDGLVAVARHLLPLTAQEALDDRLGLGVVVGRGARRGLAGASVAAGML